MQRPPHPRLIEYLSAYDQSIAALALSVRDLVLGVAPGAIESIYDAYSAVAIGFSFTGRLKDSFCHIATYEKAVNLGFNRGATLPDPEGILVGTGKQVRHIKIAKLGDLRLPSLKTYLRAAIQQVGGRADTKGLELTQFRGNYPHQRRPKKRLP